MLVKRAIIAGLLLFPALVSAGEYDGIYRQTQVSDCDAIGEEGGALQILDHEFIGVGNTCRMLRPVNVRDMDATLYDMECRLNEKSVDLGTDTSGDPASPIHYVNRRPWQERALLMHAEDGGLIMLWNGYAFKYDRCPEPE